MMPVAPVYCEVSELLEHPIRSGIQRVTRQVLRHWSGPRPLRICRYDEAQDRLSEVPGEALYFLLEGQNASAGLSTAELRHELHRIIAAHAGAEVPDDATILIPELFFGAARARHHLRRLDRRADRLHMIFHDFIPWLHPELIGVERSEHMMWYLKLAQAVRRPAFVSEASAQEWSERIVRDRSRETAVLPLGADGLGAARQQWQAGRREFVVLGSIDGRKNQLAVLDAFERLWADGVDADLCFVGYVFDQERHVSERLRTAARTSRFRHVSGATDDDVRAILGSARATIYPSTIEGFGLPPVESLAMGVPCIVGAHIPSIAKLGGRGMILLPQTTPEAIAAAVTRLLRDGEAERLWTEAATLALPTWQQFGAAVAAWVGT